MTQKEIDELKERVYAISYSKFPLDTFFNDIKMNKDANYSKEMAYEDLKLITDEIYRLRELEKTPTLEQVKKEWEELGYVWTEGVMYIHLIRLEKDICISKMDKEYECYDADNHDYQSLTLTLQEHRLLTKTFKELGWEI